MVVGTKAVCGVAFCQLCVRKLASGLMLRRSSSSFLMNHNHWPKAPTCKRTLAVSRGKVRRSAKQAAVPAPRNFTTVVGGTSEG